MVVRTGIRRATAPNIMRRTPWSAVPTPGQVLLTQWLIPWGQTQRELARRLGVNDQRVHALVNGKSRMSAEWAQVLARVFNNKPQYWMQLGVEWELNQYKVPAKTLEMITPFDPAIEAFEPRETP